MTHNGKKEEADKEVARYKQNIDVAMADFNKGVIKLVKEAMLKIDGAFAPPDEYEPPNLIPPNSEKKDG